MSRKLLAGWLLVCLGLSAVVTGWWMAGNAHAASGVAAGAPETSSAMAHEDLIRVHVIANSDSPEDQALKLKVRDAVLADLAPRLASAASVAEAETTITAALSNLQVIAAQVIEAQGFAYGARVELGQFAFPGKSYGDLYLPAGEYKALRIVLGEGQGANFWCLVYPYFCYTLHEVQKHKGGSSAPNSGSALDDRW